MHAQFRISPALTRKISLGALYPMILIFQCDLN